MEINYSNKSLGSSRPPRRMRRQPLPFLSGKSHPLRERRALIGHNRGICKCPGGRGAAREREMLQCAAEGGGRGGRPAGGRAFRALSSGQRLGGQWLREPPNAAATATQGKWRVILTNRGAQPGVGGLPCSPSGTHPVDARLRANPRRPPLQPRVG